MTEPTPPPPPPTPPSDSAPPPPPGGGSTPPPPTSGGGGAVSDNRTLMIVLSYLGPLCLIPLLAEKEDQEVQWHAKHGLVLLGVGIAIGVLYTFLSIISGGILGCVLAIVVVPIGLALFVIHIVCIFKGINGERFKLPVISDLPDQFSI
ncbi:MAG: hypothetical protein AAGA81_10245 [Acidobacteriota bacterium]